VESLLDEIHVQMADFEVYAVTAGPGSFTGLRVGLTAVKAWSEVHHKPIAAVSGLQAVAAQATDPSEFVAAILDGRRSQVFGALFRKAGGRLEWVGEEVVMSPREFVAEVSKRLSGQGPDCQVTFASPTPELFREALSSSGLRGVSAQTVSNDLAPWVGRLAYDQAQRGNLVDALTLDANYIRRTDAESYWKDSVSLPPKGKIILRPLTREDAPELSSIESLCPEAPHWGEIGYQQIGVNGIEGWGAHTGNSLDGSVLVRVVADEMEILNVAVKPMARRRGMASRLLTEAFAHASKHTVTRAYLEVRESNAGARAFYTSQGFSEQGRRKRYYADPTEDALVLVKAITGTPAQ
jgi:tRNA threonylcarbamoyl adenosine modification protein YeaZ/ribosomal-protein-alanine acetyltransferase